MKKFKHVKRQIQKKSNFLHSKIFTSIIKPFSRFFRHVFEFKRARQIVGLIVVILASLAAFLPISLATAQTVIDQNFTHLINTEEEVIKTEKSIRLPLQNFTLTQGFYFFHPGVDFAGTKGSPVYPIMVGTVTQVGQGRFAYGNYVIIDHGSGLKTLYAHLAKTEAISGEKVTKNSIIGLLGSTGWSTGPHLHFQVWQEGKLVNPKTFFESYFGQKLARIR